jgi:hypothetical protein
MPRAVHKSGDEVVFRECIWAKGNDQAAQSARSDMWSRGKQNRRGRRVLAKLALLNFSTSGSIRARISSPVLSGTSVTFMSEAFDGLLVSQPIIPQAQVN